MLQSMTGFGSAQGVIEGVEYAVEVRSVNNRYLKIGIKVPEIWASAESQIEALVRRKLSRGSVTAAVRMRVPDDQAAYQVNSAVLSRYLDQVKLLEVDGDPVLRIDLGVMLQLPGVLEPPPLDQLCERTGEGLLALVGQALDAMMTMRQAEGEAARNDLEKLCGDIERNLKTVIERSPLVVGEYHQRLAQRVSELTAQARLNLEGDTLAREVALFADRCDVAEEISRLSGHLSQFRQAMDTPEPSGRKLDFIAQEMLREANTIASKANDSQIAWAVVDIKTAIDRIKEQVQNVE
ncbi:MAG: hypothetical protein BWX88_00608 [Planctomycetes bacterium ADurb.Bin126]|nr:MAG: hypothetical protein BWX88_00608 [Planctomycetes bacterium ADurb.Bin126]HOD80892.1 YicC family protein [Phycisphaerae bacterium]HQL72257.1 YicC family protein [Phycisphaerae bacterium]